MPDAQVSFSKVTSPEFKMEWRVFQHEAFLFDCEVLSPSRLRSKTIQYCFFRFVALASTCFHAPP